MRDFTFGKYHELCESLLSNKFVSKRLDEYFANQDIDNKIFVMRHDVDKKPYNALKIAQIENKLGINSTFYFRTTKEVFRKDIILEIKNLGHEIGYHYEVLAKSNGNFEVAINLFNEELSRFRDLVNVKTISRHGSPMSKWNDINLWKKYDYSKYGIECEAYLDIDYSNTHYVTDTGRRWDGDKYNIRDKVANGLKIGEISKTDDLIKNVSGISSPIIINTHPQRWNNNLLLWYREFLLQNIKNIGKRYFLMRRNNEINNKL